MQNIVRTAAAAALQTAQYLNKPLEIKANSTLNQKFDIQASVAISSDDRVAMRYATIGNGGHRFIVGAEGVSRPEPVQHLPRHTALYNHLPFVLRLPNNDLDPTARAKYRLRRHEIHDGQTYVAYYLKTLDLSNTQPQLELRSVNNGVVTSTPFTPTLSDMNPTPPAIGNNGALVTTGDYVASTAKVAFTMDSLEVDELLNVANILYGDDNYAIVSEIGLCSGVDRVVTGDFNGSSSTYTEAIGVQVCTFVDQFIAAKFTNKSISLNFDVGSVEPLLALS